MTDDDPMPCPFCGREPRLAPGPSYYRIVCAGSDGHTADVVAGDYAEARDLWNARRQAPFALSVATEPVRLEACPPGLFVGEDGELGFKPAADPTATNRIAAYTVADGVFIYGEGTIAQRRLRVRPVTAAPPDNQQDQISLLKERVLTIEADNAALERQRDELQSRIAARESENAAQRQRIAQLVETVRTKNNAAEDAAGITRDLRKQIVNLEESSKDNSELMARLRAVREALGD
jgi:hypothetical protein